MAGSVNDKSSAYKAMEPRWRKANALLGGTDAMRAAGETYLPRHDAETRKAYRTRLTRTVLLNFYAKTAHSLASKPFAEPVKLGENFPEELRVLSEDVSMGSDLTAFASPVFLNGVTKGLVGILVDFPKVDPEKVRTLADEQAVKPRPYFVHIDPEDILAAYVENVDGKERFVHVRIREWEVRREGLEEVLVERVRVWEPNTWELWERTEDKPFVKVEEDQNQLGEVPLAMFYAQREGVMLSKSPLEDLADKNIEHWQASSDQRHALTVSRFPILAGSGISDTQKIVIGAGKILTTQDPQGKIYYVEHSGAALEAGRQDLEDLKDEMEMLGLALLVKRTGNATATATAMSGAQSHCELQRMAWSFSDTLELAFYFAGKWLHLEMSDKDVKVELNTDFGIEEGEAADLDALFKARQRGDISRETYLAELKRRKTLRADFDAEKDAQLLEEEGPALASFRAPLPDPKQLPSGAPISPQGS